MENFHEGKFGTRILSPNEILNSNKNEIEELIKHIATQNNVTIEDAALALQNALLRYLGGTKPQ